MCVCVCVFVAFCFCIFFFLLNLFGVFVALCCVVLCIGCVLRILCFLSGKSSQCIIAIYMPNNGAHANIFGRQQTELLATGIRL